MADAPHKLDDGGQPQISAAAAPVQATSPPVPKVIVVIATGWGPLYGGINSFSFDFSLALGRMLRGSVRVICLTTNVDDLTRGQVRADHVEIFTLPQVGPGNELAVATKAREVLNQHGITSIDLVFGHDVVTGPAAIELVNLMGGKAALFHHMSYIQYQSVKKDGRTAVQMDDSQKHVLRKAHYVIAVGPLLKESAERLCQRTVAMVVPGMAEIPPVTLRGADAFRAITFGRMGGEDDPIKQGSLAVAGYGRYVKRAEEAQAERNHQFTMYDLPQDQYETEEKTLKELMRKEAGRQITVNATVYTDDRRKLFEALADNEVALMLSWHEGFGLVGWEAIAAGVPLVVSKGTGLYKLLNSPEDPIGAACVSVVDVRGSDGGVPNDADVTKVAEALLRIAVNWKDSYQKAIKLRSLLAEKYTWEGCARDALDACEFPFVAADPETTRSSESPTTRQSATRSKLHLFGLLGLLLAAVTAVVLVLPQALGPGVGPEQSGPAAKSKDNLDQPTPEVKREPPAPLKPVQPEKTTCYLGDGEAEKRSLFPLDCQGGHADRRVHLVPTQPADLMRADATLVWVASCVEYRHLSQEAIDKLAKSPPKSDGPGYRFIFVPTDKHRVEVEGISLYELRVSDGVVGLVHVGEVDVRVYKNLVENGASETTKGPKNALYLRTRPGDHRRVEFAAVKCLDGPAAMKYVPVLLDPDAAVASASILWPVLDLESRPPDPPWLLSSRRDWKDPEYVAHLSWYRIAKHEDGTFEGRFAFHADAEAYVEKHRHPLTLKLPILLKELENLKKRMSEDIALVRKDYAAKKIHPGSAKVGEERYASVLAKHNANIEHLIEALTGKNPFSARRDIERVFEEEGSAIDAFLAWHDQRDLPPDIPIKSPEYHRRMDKLVKLADSMRAMSSEYAALNDDGQTGMRMQLRAMAFEPWPIRGD
jgi:glycosyltransferase involved in cell wall biosynthesis